MPSKGTAAWGTELNRGRILFIEHLDIDKEYRRQGYGRRIVEDTWEQAQRLTDNCDFAIVWVAYLDPHAIDREASQLSIDQVSELKSNAHGVSEDFWRSLGFRRIGSSTWFARAKDPAHPSNALNANNDYRRPSALGSQSMQFDQLWPYDSAILQATDAATLSLLRLRLASTPASDPRWLLVDGHGNTIMHVLATERKPESLAWLLNQSFGTDLSRIRNLEGETPLDALQVQLERRRSRKDRGGMTIVVSDDFNGFKPNEVACLQILEGHADPSEDLMLRLKFGCTCGQCIGGFLSPRTSFVIRYEAEDKCDAIRGCFSLIAGSEWRELMRHHLRLIGPDFETKLCADASLRRGFTAVLAHIAESLGRKKVPVTANVAECFDDECLECLDDGCYDDECATAISDVLNVTATVASCFIGCVAIVIENDLYLGNGSHEEHLGEIMEKLPKCRNDREFGFACRQYCVQAGLGVRAARSIVERMGGCW